MTSLKTEDFNYHLPAELIAQTPSKRRDASRLLVLHKDTGKIEHRIFSNIRDYVTSKDLLVLNDTKVIPARLFGSKYGGGARIEVLLDRRLDERLWEALARPAKRLEKGDVIEFTNGLYAEVREEVGDGRFMIRFASVKDIDASIKKIGNVPLPPYIKVQDQAKRYQTVYARKEGASAAPTAGLHFTTALLDSIKAKKVYVTLHTGYGTFAPVRSEYIEDHKMHSESFEITEKAVRAVKAVRAGKGKVFAVGTTSVRLLESAAEAGKGETDIFIYPGFKFKVVDAMITNFHLPKSTLLMLVSAFAGKDLIEKAYKEAVKEKYRFFSFGDAMLIL